MARRRGTYTPPVSGPAGRTDEGVDWVTRPGSAVRSIGAGIVDFVGRYTGFGPYVAYHLTEGPLAGQEIYTAEFARATVRPRQRIAAGQQIGVAASGIEAGFAQGGPTYLPEAQVEGPHGEGVVTPAGRRFRAALGGQTGDTNTLGQIWIQGGGSPKLANLMAAIALAESGGKVDAEHTNADGSIDRGLWQINSSHAMYDPQRLLDDPVYNAHAAAAVERTQGLGAWTTYSSGAYRQYLPGARNRPVKGGVVRPGGGPPGGDDGAAASDAQLADWKTYVNPEGFLDPKQYINPLDPLGPFGPGLPWNPLNLFKDAQSAVSDAKTFLQWIAWIFHPRNILRIVEFLAGSGLLAVGIVFAYRDSQRGGGRQFPKGGKSLKSVVSTAATVTPQGRAVKAASKASRLAQAGEGAGKVRRAEETHATKLKTEKAKATELRTRGGRRPRGVKKKGPVGFA